MEDLESADKSDFDVTAFTHLDDDHVCGASDFFYLEHAEKYRVNGRPKIGELWVPAAALVEEGLEGDARIIRSEARYRFKAKTRHSCILATGSTEGMDGTRKPRLRGA